MQAELQFREIRSKCLILLLVRFFLKVEGNYRIKGSDHCCELTWDSKEKNDSSSWLTRPDYRALTAALTGLQMQDILFFQVHQLLLWLISVSCQGVLHLICIARLTRLKNLYTNMALLLLVVKLPFLS